MKWVRISENRILWWRNTYMNMYHPQKQFNRSYKGQYVWYFASGMHWLYNYCITGYWSLPTSATLDRFGNDRCKRLQISSRSSGLLSSCFVYLLSYPQKSSSVIMCCPSTTIVDYCANHDAKFTFIMALHILWNKMPGPSCIGKNTLWLSNPVSRTGQHLTWATWITWDFSRIYQDNFSPLHPHPMKIFRLQIWLGRFIVAIPSWTPGLGYIPLCNCTTDKDFHSKIPQRLM